MQTKGFGNLSKRLNQLSENLRDLGETKSASLTEILNPAFIAQHTKFADANEFFEASGFDISSQSSFESIPVDKLDAFVCSVSAFGSWKAMLSAAGAAWAKQKLGLG